MLPKPGFERQYHGSLVCYATNCVTQTDEIIASPAERIDNSSTNKKKVNKCLIKQKETNAYITGSDNLFEKKKDC